MKQVDYFKTSIKYSLVVFFNLTLLFYGICVAYSNIQFLSYGEYKSAIELSGDFVRFFDIVIKV